MTSPLSQSQLSIFLACQGLDGKSGNYQIPFLYRLPAEIDLKKVCRALEAFVAAHPISFHAWASTGTTLRQSMWI